MIPRVFLFLPPSLLLLSSLSLLGCGGGAIHTDDDATAADDDTADDDSASDDDIPGTALTGIVTGDDWTLPDTVVPAENSGLYSEALDADVGIDTRVVDLTWAQLQPDDATLVTFEEGSAEGMELASWEDQLAGDDPYWMRLWISAVAWTPEWVAQECGLQIAGRDYEDQSHFPLWDPCMWSHALDLYRQVFIEQGLREDPRLRFVYVPGGFTWCEFDFDIISQAALQHGLTEEDFNAWFQQAMVDLVNIMNGENDDTSDDQAWKLVYTGEDYPFGPWDEGDDGFAHDAVSSGMGIRTGITEEFNFHLNHVPAYGTLINSDGYMETDDSWQLFDGQRIAATENECFSDCGYTVADPYYAVKMANLKALQLRMNWIYTLRESGYMDEYPDLWSWVRMELGQRPDTAPDAWVALREAEDTYWNEDESHTWEGVPWVKNWERWITQRDVEPDGVSAPGSDEVSGEVSTENGTAYEGRRTRHDLVSDYLYFDLDDTFAASLTGPVEIKVTYLDESVWEFTLEYAGPFGVRQAPAVTREDSGEWRTATWRVEDGVWDESVFPGNDFRLWNGGDEDIEVRFVRVVRLSE